MKKESVILEQINAAAEIINDENNLGMHGMTYEEGVRDALSWVIEENEDKPIDN